MIDDDAKSLFGFDIQDWREAHELFNSGQWRKATSLHHRIVMPTVALRLGYAVGRLEDLAAGKAHDGRPVEYGPPIPVRLSDGRDVIRRGILSPLPTLTAEQFADAYRRDFRNGVRGIATIRNLLPSIADAEMRLSIGEVVELAIAYLGMPNSTYILEHDPLPYENLAGQHSVGTFVDDQCVELYQCGRSVAGMIAAAKESLERSRSEIIRVQSRLYAYIDLVNDSADKPLPGGLANEPRSPNVALGMIIFRDEEQDPPVDDQDKTRRRKDLWNKFNGSHPETPADYVLAVGEASRFRRREERNGNGHP